MPSTIADDKRALRAALQTIPYPDCTALVQRLLSLDQVGRANTLLLFWGMEREPDTQPVIAALLRLGKRVCLPRCLPNRGMEARAYTGREGLVPSAYGIPEPGEDCPRVERDTIELILVPNLCCDKENYRLGHGGGYYDRYLHGYGGVTVALCPAPFLRYKVPRDEYDLPVDLVLTE